MGLSLSLIDFADLVIPEPGCVPILPPTYVTAEGVFG